MSRHNSSFWKLPQRTNPHIWVYCVCCPAVCEGPLGWRVLYIEDSIIYQCSLCMSAACNYVLIVTGAWLCPTPRAGCGDVVISPRGNIHWGGLTDQMTSSQFDGGIIISSKPLPSHTFPLFLTKKKSPELSKSFFPPLHMMQKYKGRYGTSTNQQHDEC